MRYLVNVCCVHTFMVVRSAIIRVVLCAMTVEHREMEDVDCRYIIH